MTIAPWAPLPEGAALTINLDSNPPLVVTHAGRSYRITPEMLDRLEARGGE